MNNIDIIPGEIGDFARCDLNFSENSLVHFCEEKQEQPIEDYEMPILFCRRCHESSKNKTIIYIDHQGFYYKRGLKCQSSCDLRNSYICYQCLQYVAN